MRLDPPPEVSVVVPTFNRPAQLRETLLSLAGSEVDRAAFEVLVVNDGGEAVEGVTSQVEDRLQLRVVNQVNGGPASARNSGAECSRGRFLAFTDDDCRVDPGWLRALRDRLREAPDLLVGGRTLNGLPGNPWSEANQLILEAVYGHFNRDRTRPRFFASNNMAVCASNLREAGGFRHDLPVHACEDRELCDRWLHRGGRLGFVPSAIIHHVKPLSFAGFWRQYFTYGRGAVHYQRLRRRRGSGRMRDDVGLHLHAHQWLSAPFRLARPPRAIALASLLLLWQVANAAGFAFEWTFGRRGDGLAPSRSRGRKLDSGGERGL